ncbi:hypothetical protein [Anaeromyxobacter oryzae]|uniref:Zinc ribbon domain-containing protein n=1 Tax=Anaeromyxobacter oryzae TaxID=2918170 RepID=A0ABN6MSC3_9BACT|nr:hypothetical protein [Anaeromyxobacter oryzae]BDG03879.1 hypothetical protein AMOR_28750 [Anaeromyxobacter oryzae]
MNDRLGRFRHLEGPRTERDDPATPAPTASAERFEGVERPAGGAPVAAPRTGARLDRFGPEPDPVIELVDTEGQRPFTRCIRCGMDSNVFATTCPGCGASLDTEEQRSFNERLWASRQAEAAREAAASAERQALQAAEAEEDARTRRAMAESMAREVGDLERRRLDAEEGRWSGGRWGGGWGRGGWAGEYDPTPLGLKLLRLLPGPGWQLAAAAVAVLVVGGLVISGLSGTLHGRRGPLVGLGIFLAVVLLTPPGRRWRRWWW